MKWWKVIIISLGIILLVIPIVFYIIYFSDYSISNNPADWGVFGDYVGGIYGGLFTCLITLLAVYLARALTKKDQKQVKTSATQ